MQALSKFDSDILDLTSEDDIEDEILQEDEVKEQIYQALSQLEGALKPIPAPRARVDPTIADPAGTSGTGPLASTSGTGPPSGTSGTGPLASTSGHLVHPEQAHLLAHLGQAHLLALLDRHPQELLIPVSGKR